VSAGAVKLGFLFVLKYFFLHNTALFFFAKRKFESTNNKQKKVYCGRYKH
jgi:hypothetical protein